MIRVLFCILALAAPAMAQESFPALYDVTGVAVDDTLNVRAEASANSDIVATLSPDAAGIEVLRLDPSGNWGNVVADAETSGWVAIRFLARQPDQVDGRVPAKLACSGTEPFWSMTLSEDGGAYRSPETAFALYRHVGTRNSMNRTDRFTQLYSGASGIAVATLTKGACFNMMSGMESGWAVDILRSETTIDKATMLSGCCSLAN